MSLLWISFGLVGLELLLIAIVSLCRKSFPWLITLKDEVPLFEPQALKKFIDNSFDSNLGWTRKPNSTGIENGQKGPITFHVDASGSRSIQTTATEPVLAAFGDSYAFCRQVEDEETWEAQLAVLEGVGVLNYGVGNYGVDQALLRYESTDLPDSVKVVVINFVPETICRIQSYWKHYMEFGNTFAFKPRFGLNVNGNLTLINSAVGCFEDFFKLETKLNNIRKIDGFYYKKFRRYQFRFPYMLSLFRSPIDQVKLIISISFRGLMRSIGKSNNRIDNMPFTIVMKRNLRGAYREYKSIQACKLLTAILLRFKEQALQRGHCPLVVVTPQLLDLRLIKDDVVPYGEYYSDLRKHMNVMDLTKDFYSVDYENLYVNDQYGGHLSASGNRLVARKISSWLAVNNVSIAK
jgi:hypothetical protein